MRAAYEDLMQQLNGQGARRESVRCLRGTREDFQMLMGSVTEYAIILMDREGHVTDWNRGAENILGYAKGETVGSYFCFFFTPEDKARGGPQQELQRALVQGRSVDDKWHVRKGGERFFATGLVQPMLDAHQNLRRFVTIMRDNTARRLAEEQVNYLALHDILTGLPNRTAFSNRLHEELAKATGENSLVAVLLLDLDRFKYINDTLGHHTGDLLLKEVARRVSASIRETDMVARLGGDEFAVILSHVADAGNVGACAQKIVYELAQPYLLEGFEAHSGTSVGITMFPKDAGDPVELLKNADTAMYRAKAQGRNHYEFFTETLHAEVVERKKLEDRLRRALKTEEMELFYQPQISLGNWQIIGVEALLHWKDPYLEGVPAGTLIALAEETGLIVPLGKWVLTSALQQIMKWQGEEGFPKFRVAINLSPLQLRDPRFTGGLRSALQDYGVTASAIEFEITERLLMENTTANRRILERFREIGVQIAIDDFGTGYSALSYLRDFPVDVNKIDKSMVRHLPHQRQDVAIASSIISLAQSLGINVVAEGVETTEQLAFLKSQQCGIAQCFLFSPPVPAKELEKLLRRGNWSHMNPE